MKTVMYSSELQAYLEHMESHALLSDRITEYQKMTNDLKIIYKIPIKIQYLGPNQFDALSI